MNRLLKQTLQLLLIIGLGACESDFDNKFDQLPDERINAKVGDLQETLQSAEHGWLMTYSMGNGVEYAIYGLATFNEDNTVNLRMKHLDGSITSSDSEYNLMVEGDLSLIFNTYNFNITLYSTPYVRMPKGNGGDIEFNLLMKNKNTISLEGKVYKGKMLLQRATEAEYNDKEFEMLTPQIENLNKQRTKRYMTLAVTEGLGGTEEKPVLIGLDCSTYARLAEVDYNYDGEYVSFPRYLFFTHRGFSLSNPITVADNDIQHFSYNEETERFELNHPTLKGHIYCQALPAYFVPGLYDEFMDKFSMKLRASFGKMQDKYFAMKKTNPKIKSFVLATDYKQRIPVLDDDGNYTIDPDTRLAAYNDGEDLGEGFLFSFDSFYQFDFYYVPVEVVKLEEDRIRFVRKETGEFCTADETDPSIGVSIRENKEFQELITYLCNDKGWLIKKRAENGTIDFDFYSLENTADYFYSRLY